jgi:hypothetical protein
MYRNAEVIGGFVHRFLQCVGWGLAYVVVACILAVHSIAVMLCCFVELLVDFVSGSKEKAK